MFEDLELPDLERKASARSKPTHSPKRLSPQVGIRVRLDKRRTARSRIKRKIATQRIETGRTGTRAAFPVPRRRPDATATS